MASSVRCRTISASIPGTGGGPDGSADVLADVRDSRLSGRRRRRAAGSGQQHDQGDRRPLHGPEPRAPGRLSGSLGHPRHDPAGLHAHLELLLRVGRGTATRLPAVQVERGAVQRAHQAVALPRTSSTVPWSSGPDRCEQAARKTSTRAPRRTAASGTATLFPGPVRSVGRPSGKSSSGPRSIQSEVSARAAVAAWDAPDDCA